MRPWIGMAACNHDEILISIPFPAALALTARCSSALCAVTTDIAFSGSGRGGRVRDPAIQNNAD
ncbi:hypothetical protein LY78DRAFT_397213 [Colletotrichum sublineola]|nr:hypothetical protein LY78DRAFT_397213 [Colletotrichum sublineola]